MTPDPPTRNRRPRRIFGRRWVTLDGVAYRIELRAGQVVVRRKHSRSEWTLPLVDLIHESLGQKTFKF